MFCLERIRFMIVYLISAALKMALSSLVWELCLFYMLCCIWHQASAFSPRILFSALCWFSHCSMLPLDFYCVFRCQLNFPLILTLCIKLVTFRISQVLFWVLLCSSHHSKCAIEECLIKKDWPQGNEVIATWRRQGIYILV